MSRIWSFQSTSNWRQGKKILILIQYSKTKLSISLLSLLKSEISQVKISLKKRGGWEDTICNSIMASNLEQAFVNSSNWLMYLKAQNIQYAHTHKKIMYLYYCTERLNLTSVLKTQEARISLNNWNTKSRQAYKAFTILKED